MASTKLHSMIQESHGQAGEAVSLRSPSEETVISLAPGKSAPPHGADAQAYARAAMADPEMRAFYEQEAEGEGKDAYILAYSNYFKIQKRLGE